MFKISIFSLAEGECGQIANFADVMQKAGPS